MSRSDEAESTRFPRSTALMAKHVVVIGASSGMGHAVSRAVAGAGATVTMASRSLERLEAARRDIPGQTDVVTVDMLDEASVARLFEGVGSFDHLVITAVADEAALYSPFSTMPTEVAFAR